MPELPEIETIKTAVSEGIGCCKIEKVQIFNRNLRKEIPHDFEKTIEGTFIKLYRRIAKYIVFDLRNNYSILWHMGMSGTLRICEKQPLLEKHDHVLIKTSNGFLVYNDPRRFGLVSCCETNRLFESPFFKNIGYDPFDANLTSDILFSLLQNKQGEIKPLLLDQSFIAGIGNIYASEILYDAKISPLRKANSLSKKDCVSLLNSMYHILKQAIDAGGSSLKDYKKPDGKLGYFQNMHCVYNKTGQQCPKCSCHVGIKKIEQQGRSTFYCERLQK